MAIEFMTAHGQAQTYGEFGFQVFEHMARADQKAHRGLIVGFMSTLVRISQEDWSPQRLARIGEFLAEKHQQDKERLAAMFGKTNARNER
jgi:hypothetical protein